MNHLSLTVRQGVAASVLSFFNKLRDDDDRKTDAGNEEVYLNWFHKNFLYLDHFNLIFGKSFIKIVSSVCKKFSTLFFFSYFLINYDDDGFRGMLTQKTYLTSFDTTLLIKSCVFTRVLKNDP